ncbi:hypothetical protein HNQ59_003051 [Chitinivorax tropicus]|uniref:Uncharacterized protein n=1 Tax=Chitinivorax tropicus TaxID=714531 RepID=A0A840MTX0_9PROT|nr:hypothetical protein [Chitinivorax tropicus]
MGTQIRAIRMVRHWGSDLALAGKSRYRQRLLLDGAGRGLSLVV